MPGKMTPPQVLPVGAETQSKVVAVPKSTATTGAPINSMAATEFTIRSAPTSRGFSYRTGMPVRVPGPTTSGADSKSLKQTRSQMGSRGGTTLEMIAWVTSAEATPSAGSKSDRSVTATSSEVCSRCVAMRQ